MESLSNFATLILFFYDLDFSKVIGAFNCQGAVFWQRFYCRKMLLNGTSTCNRVQITIHLSAAMTLNVHQGEMIGSSLTLATSWLYLLFMIIWRRCTIRRGSMASKQTSGISVSGVIYLSLLKVFDQNVPLKSEWGPLCQSCMNRRWEFLIVKEAKSQGMWPKWRWQTNLVHTYYRPRSIIKLTETPLQIIVSVQNREFPIANLKTFHRN